MMLHRDALIVFLAVFGLICILGFWAARFRQAESGELHEWSLGGRRFGTLISWFLIGGDLYTAYTFIAIPALVFGAGAVGFYGIPYTILIYPLIFAIMPRLWSVCRAHNYVTAADFVRGSFKSPLLAAAVAITGILATMPYIALQLVGMQTVTSALGFPMHGVWANLPLAFAFATVAGYTFTSGIRAPAMIAIAKDVLIYVTIITAIAVIPAKLGGFAAIFAHVPPAHVLLAMPARTNAGGITGYASLAIGSAIALVLYPHSLTAMLSAASRQTIRRNAILLPAYSLLLGFLSLLGFMAVAAHVDAIPAYAPFFAKYHASFAVPALFLHYFPDWFVGIAFAAIVVGALVPAAIMAIAAANLFTRNIYREYFDPALHGAHETRVAKFASVAVIAGALVFVFALPAAFAVQLQLLGGIWIIQTAPAILAGLFAPWYEARGLGLGWLAGMLCGTVLAAGNGFAPVVPVVLFGYSMPLYIAVIALLVNLAVATVTGAVVRFQGFPRGGPNTLGV